MEDFRKKLQRNHVWLLENLDVDSGLLDWLYEAEILTPEQFDRLRAERTTREKIRRLLVSCLQRRSSKIYRRFLDGLKCNQQRHIVYRLERSLPAEDITESQTDEAGQDGSVQSQNSLDITESQADEAEEDGLTPSQNSCIVGFVHNVQEKRKSKNGHYFLSFYLQSGSDEFERCLSFSPDWHWTSLRSFEENRQPVCIARFMYMDPSEGYNDRPPIMITEHSHMSELVDEKDVGFAYKEMPIVFTSLDQLPNGEFVNIRIKVISQGNVESRSVKRKWEEEEDCSMAFQLKCVQDENGNRAMLSAWDDFVYKISPEEGFMEIMDVSVKEFQNVKQLNTNVNTTILLKESKRLLEALNS